MKVNIHSQNLHVDQSLVDFINKKIDKLLTFHNGILDTAVYLRDEGGLEKEVEIKLNVKSQTLFCKEKGESFEKAMELASDKMKRQLQKYKQK